MVALPDRCRHCQAPLPNSAVVALLTGRYRLSRREVQQALLDDLWDVKLSLGGCWRQERAQSAAVAPVVAEVCAAVQPCSRRQ